jgi:hypothetical protein
VAFIEGEAGAQLFGDARAYMPQLMAQGFGPSEALGLFRDAGGAVRTQTWYQAWGELAADYAGRSTWQTADLAQPVIPSELPTWAAGREGQFGYKVGAVVRDRTTGLTDIRTHLVFSTEALAPQAAVDSMIQTYEDEQTAGGPSGVLVTAYFIQAYQMTGPA